MFGRRRRSLRFWLSVACAAAFAMLGFVLWQLDTLQPKVAAMVGPQPTATPNAFEYARKADAAFWQGDLNTAISAYREAANSAPTNVDILYELARMLIYRSYGDVRNSADVDEAQKWGAQAIQAAPDNARAYTINCFALLTASKSEDAVRSCVRALDLDRANADAHAYLALAYYDLGRTSSALQEGETAVQLNDKSIDAQTAYAFALWFQGRTTQALEHFKQAAEINQRLEFPYFNMGGFASALGTTDDTKYLLAIDVYNTVLSFNKTSVKAYTRLCQTYFAKASRSVEDIRLARDNCEQATELDGQYATGWRWLGQVQYFSRNYEGSLESFDKCYELEKDLPSQNREVECWYLRASAYFILAECEKAFPIIDDMLQWTTADWVDKARVLINKCQYAYKGEYKTPTPVPTPMPKPTPIL